MSKQRNLPHGFFVEGKEWDSVPPQRPGFYEENPPETWEECQQCSGYHPPGYAGDCRSDINRWPSQKAIDAMENRRSNANRE